MNEAYMNMAIELAKKGIGFVNPDPLSGTVIVKNNKIISEGYHAYKGSEKSETMALKNATENLIGAELYTNIEPSANEIIQSHIKKIYIGILDPRLQNSGDSIELMKQCGIEVQINILKDRCEELNEISTYYYKHGTPFVFTKWAMTLDGKIATRTGDSKWISSSESLKFVHNLRQRVAAIMVGENTVRIDNPLLTTRLKGVEISNPLRVILSKYGDISKNANILKVDEKTKTLIIASEKIPKEKENVLLNKGVELLKLPESCGKINFKDIVCGLGRRGIDSLYIEGGSGVLASAFESGIVSKVYAAIAPKIIGGIDAITPVGGVGIERMNDAIVLKRVTHEIIGDDVIFSGYI